MKRFNWLGLFLLLVLLWWTTPPVYAQSAVFQDGTNKGAVTDFDFTHAQVSGGMHKTIDVSDMRQADATATTTPVVTFTQAATTGQFFKFAGTAAALNAISCYTTTSASKKGSIRINVPGLSCGDHCWINVYEAPN